jgi:uncharacterized protein (DUF302 family)
MYHFNVSVDLPFEEAKTKLIAALQAKKLGIVSEVNVQAIMQNKMGISIPPYLILGACAPNLAKQVLDADLNAGALLPCNVVLYQTAGGKVEIVFMNPEPVLSLANNPQINQVAETAKIILDHVCTSLK